MRHEMISGYLSAPGEMGKKEMKKKDTKVIPTKSRIQSVAKSSVIKCQFEVPRPDRERKYKHENGRLL
jgi:hypothetical protein